MICIFFFNDTATTEIYTLSLHDALPISSTSNSQTGSPSSSLKSRMIVSPGDFGPVTSRKTIMRDFRRSEEHTSELQSRQYLVCRLLLEKKITTYIGLLLRV